jgi:hypothetical protein
VLISFGTINWLPYDSLYLGWIGMVLGILSGAFIGLFFHQEHWLGGYNSFPRRLVRLGHISFFGLGILSVLLGLGLLTLAGLTPDSWEISYHNVFDLNKLEKIPGPFEVVAISSLAAQVYEAYKLADRYRAQGCCVVMGGLHVSAEPEEALQHADAIVIEEAEPVTRQFLIDEKRETQAGRCVYADWSWVVPPISSGTTPVFHRKFKNRILRPNFFPQSEPWQRSGGGSCPYAY